MNEEIAPVWERMEGEPILWYGRFDRFFRPMGTERTLLGAFHQWWLEDRKEKKRNTEAQQKKAGKAAEPAPEDKQGKPDAPGGEEDTPPSPPRSYPISWTNAASKWKWRERAEAWDAQERIERLKREEREREESRQRRIRTLNALMTKVQLATLSLDPESAKWSDVTAAVRATVQELRHEYEGDVKKVKVEQSPGGDLSMDELGRLPAEQLAAMIDNLLLLQDTEEQGDQDDE